MPLSNFEYEIRNGKYVITGVKDFKIKELIIPEGVYQIEECAFSDLLIEKVYFPTTLEMICNCAFEFCEHLKEIHFKEKCKLKIIDESAFTNCYKLEKVILPSGVEEIAYNAFYSCSSLKEVFIPSTVKKMGANIFEECNSLKVINLEHTSIPKSFHIYWNEDNIKVNLSIKKSADSYYHSSVTKPISSNNIVNTTTVVEKKVESKPTIKVTPTVKQEDDLSDFIVEKDEKERLIIAGLKNENLKHIIVPKSIKGIKEEAFYNNKNVEGLTTHDEFEYIGTRAFAYSRIKRINLGKQTYVGFRSFECCEQLENIHIPYLTGEYAFGGCLNAKTIKINDGVTSLTNCVCAGCSSLEELYMPDSVTMLSFECFKYCGFKKVRLSNNLTYLPVYLFDSCRNLKEITLPKNLRSVGERAFWCCSALEKINFNNIIQSLDLCAFAHCDAITKLVIPPSMIRIEKCALSSKNIKEIIIERYSDQKQEIPCSFVKTWYDEKAKPIIKFKTVKRV